ncbi:hypothetical protein ACSSS7_002806 [Eimeria intestinalis]
MADSSALVQAISTARVHVHPIPLLVERRSFRGSRDEPPPTKNWGQLRVSLKADEWRFAAPHHPVMIEVGAVTLLSPKEGLMPEDGAKYLKVQPDRLVFSPEGAAEVQAINIQPWSPGVLVGSEKFSPPSSEVFIGAFSVQLHAVSEDPAWSSAVVSFDFPLLSSLHDVTSIMPEVANSVVVFAQDSDTRELLLSFPNSQLVREGEKHSVASSRADNEWLVRGGHEVAFSVWDDDIPGVTWLSDPEALDSPSPTLAFTLSSQPVHPVSLTLKCEGTEVTSHQFEQGHAKEIPDDDANASQEAGTVLINPQDWQKVYKFSLQVTNITSASTYMAEGGEKGEIFVSRCILKASSNDANYNSGNFGMSFKSQDERLVAAGQEFMDGQSYCRVRAVPARLRMPIPERVASAVPSRTHVLRWAYRLCPVS